MSKGEDKLGELLKREFRSSVVFPQYHIRYKGRSMYIDFFMPGLKLAFEYDGLQHFQYIRKWHKSKKGFADHQLRDRRKQEWCDENGITLVRLDHTSPVTLRLLRKLVLKALAEKERIRDVARSDADGSPSETPHVEVRRRRTKDGRFARKTRNVSTDTVDIIKHSDE